MPESAAAINLRLLRSARAGAFAAVVLAAVSLWIVSQGASPQPERLASLVLLLFEQGVIVLAYLAAAAGWGCLVARLLREPALDAAGFAGRLILGVGIMALIMWLLGWAGYLNVVAAWAVGTLGWALAGYFIYQTRESWWLEPADRWPNLPWPILLAIPHAVLLLGAACIPPGILWASEFGGYDALSYHLQLPREWIDTGAVEGLTHNAYSYFPSLFEVAFAQLGLWRSEIVGASYTTQLLHATMAILTAIVIGQIVRDTLARTTDRQTATLAGAMSGCLYIAIPWTLVTGSLAYNEQTLAAFTALALAAVLHRENHPAAPQADADAPQITPHTSNFKHGLIVGLPVGLAVLTKLTAIGFVALPLAALLAMNRTGGRNPRLARLAGFALGSGLLLGLWMLRNYTWTANPTFPLLTGLFGTAHWSPEQAARWDAGHSGNLLHGLLALGPAGLWHLQFGLVIWPLTIAATILACRHHTPPAPPTPPAREGEPQTQPAALHPALAWTQKLRHLPQPHQLLLIAIAIQLLFWWLFTHHQSRFLIPLLLPAVVLIGLSWPAWQPRRLSLPLAPTLIAAAIVLCTMINYSLYFTERNGTAAAFIDRLEQMRQFDPRADLRTPWNMINATVPPDGRIYAEAFAIPYYVDRPITYHTVWDASPLGPHLADTPQAAHAWLVEHGYTHVIVDWSMLALWHEPDNYGYDPNIDPDNLQTFAADYLDPIATFEGVTLFAVP